jgi:hypothetical protein
VAVIRLIEAAATYTLLLQGVVGIWYPGWRMADVCIETMLFFC